MMDLGMSGYQLLGGIASGYVGDAPTSSNVQVEETSDTLLHQWVMPYHCEIIDFGVVITEDFVAQATDPVVSLKRASTLGGTETVIRALTLGGSNTAGLTKGNKVARAATYGKDNQTQLSADTDLDTGDVVHADLFRTDPSTRFLVPGEVLILEHTTAATGAGGAYVPFVLVKISGPEFVHDNVWRELREGEVVGD